MIEALFYNKMGTLLLIQRDAIFHHFIFTFIFVMRQRHVSDWEASSDPTSTRKSENRSLRQDLRETNGWSVDETRLSNSVRATASNRPFWSHLDSIRTVNYDFHSKVLYWRPALKKTTRQFISFITGSLFKPDRARAFLVTVLICSYNNDAVCVSGAHAWILFMLL